MCIYCVQTLRTIVESPATLRTRAELSISKVLITLRTTVESPGLLYSMMTNSQDKCLVASNLRLVPSLDNTVYDPREL